MGFKARVDPLACFLAYVTLRFTFGVTPADCRGQHGSRAFLMVNKLLHMEITDSNVLKFGYNEYSFTTSSFFCIF